MQHTIKSRRLGELTFSRPGSHYVYCDMGNPKNHGTLGRQICVSGKLAGPTVSYGGDSEKSFARVCQNWLRAHYRHLDRN